MKSDKGRDLVIMDKPQYLEKMREITSTKSYVELKKTPLPSMIKGTNKLLKDILRVFGPKVKWKLMVANPSVPKLYGLPKTHKPTLSMRPIISNINSPTEKIAKWLLSELQSYRQEESKSVSNTYDFLEKIKNVRLEENEVLISFDVVALFPSIPIRETLELLRKWLDEREDNEEKKKVFYDAVSLCMEYNYCQIENKYYKITEGTTMGNSLSPFIADLFMSYFEKSLEEEGNLPKIWFRYVDDIFSCIDPNKIQSFMEIINSKWPTLKFTNEMEKDKQLPFLDILIKRNIENKLEFSIYRKPTNIPRYIPNDSFCPNQYKLAAFNSMVFRLCKVPMNAKSYMDELKYIKYAAELNGYDSKMIDAMVEKQSRKLRMLSLTKLQTQKEKDDNIKRLKIHFAPTITNKLTKVFKQHKIDLVYTSEGKLKHKLGSTKDKTENLKKSGIYEIKCNNCDQRYYGQTKRNIETRFAEHLTNVKFNRPNKSAVALHIMENGHSVTKDNVKLIKQVNDERFLDAYESIYMHKNKNIMMNTMEAPIRSSLFNILN